MANLETYEGGTPAITRWPIWFLNGINSYTITGTSTLTKKSGMVVSVDGGVGDRDLNLDSDDASQEGRTHWVRNAGSTNNLVLKNAAGTTLGTIAPGGIGYVAHNGTTWIANYFGAGGGSKTTSASGTGATGTGTASITVGGTTATTTATNTAITEARSAYVAKPATPEATAVACTLVTDATVANGVAMTIAAQPAYPCKLAVIITDADSSISAGIVTVIGVDASGRSVTETVSLTGGSQTRSTNNAYSSITSITPSAVVGNTGSDKVAVGHSNKLGVPLPSGFGSLSFYFLQADGTKEAVSASDATYGTFTPTTAPNAAHNYEVMYSFSLPVVQASHSHSGTGLTANDAGHTHTGPSHTHTVTV